MPILTPPKAVAVEVVAAEPTEADSAAIAQFAMPVAKGRPPAAYIVKVKLAAVPEASSQGWALYVDDLRIPKYWEYAKGIYFKVFDPQFFADHAGAKLRFSSNGSEFIETGLTLSGPAAAKKSSRAATRLPRQATVLK